MLEGEGRGIVMGAPCLLDVKTYHVDFYTRVFRAKLTSPVFFNVYSERSTAKIEK